MSHIAGRTIFRYPIRLNIDAKIRIKNFFRRFASSIAYFVIAGVSISKKVSNRPRLLYIRVGTMVILTDS